MLSILFITLLNAQAAVTPLAPGEQVRHNSDGKIEICYATPLSSTNLLKEIIDYTTSELGRAGLAVEFKADCLTLKDPFFPIAIAFYDDPLTTEGIRSDVRSMTENPDHPGHPFTYAKGARVHRGLIDVVLTTRFQKVHEGLTEQAKDLSDKGKRNLLKTIALHELMHALGLVHEQNHRDSTCMESEERYSPKTHTLLTEYDPDSIMNYCLTHYYDYELGPLSLSSGDLKGLKVIYSLSM